MSEFWIPVVLHPVLQHSFQEGIEAVCAFKVPFTKASRHSFLINKQELKFVEAFEAAQKQHWYYYQLTHT